MTLPQLVCRKLPFEGESMAQVMFVIADKTDRDIRPQGTGLLACVPPIPVAPAGGA